MAQRHDPNSEDNVTLRGGQGAAVKAGQTSGTDGNLRAEYDHRVSNAGSGPESSALRKAIRADIRERSTPFGRGLAEHRKTRPSAPRGWPRRPTEELAASAARSNAGVNALGKGFRYGGKALVGVGAAISVYDVATAPPGQRVEQATKEAGSWAGALAFGTARHGGAARRWALGSCPAWEP